jgi:hypothetical protein
VRNGRFSAFWGERGDLNHNIRPGAVKKFLHRAGRRSKFGIKPEPLPVIGRSVPCGVNTDDPKRISTSLLSKEPGKSLPDVTVANQRNSQV